MKLRKRIWIRSFFSVWFFGADRRWFLVRDIISQYCSFIEIIYYADNYLYSLSCLVVYIVYKYLFIVLVCLLYVLYCLYHTVCLYGTYYTVLVMAPLASPATTANHSSASPPNALVSSGTGSVPWDRVSTDVMFIRRVQVQVRRQYTSRYRVWRVCIGIQVLVIELVKIGWYWSIYLIKQLETNRLLSPVTGSISSVSSLNRLSAEAQNNDHNWTAPEQGAAINVYKYEVAGGNILTDIKP